MDMTHQPLLKVADQRPALARNECPLIIAANVRVASLVDKEQEAYPKLAKDVEESTMVKFDEIMEQYVYQWDFNHAHVSVTL
jgi:hypothetical protein